MTYTINYKEATKELKELLLFNKDEKIAIDELMEWIADDLKQEAISEPYFKETSKQLQQLKDTNYTSIILRREDK